jgi:hypothetical protein
VSIQFLSLIVHFLLLLFLIAVIGPAYITITDRKQPLRVSDLLRRGAQRVFRAMRPRGLLQGSFHTIVGCAVC